MTQPATLVDVLRHRALHQPDDLAYTFLIDGEEEGARLTFAGLDQHARAIAARLQGLGAAGGRALLLYPAGLDYVAAFFGCLYAGVTAVPAYPPRKNRSMDRIDRIVDDAQATVIMTTEQTLDTIGRHFSGEQSHGIRHTLATDGLPLDGADTWQPPSLDADTVAFLQYTSGSTGTPKGVMVTHGNLIHNETLIARAFHTEEPGTRMLGWLPLYHDMGLIGNLLQPMYSGTSCVLMAPVAFLQKPVRWLQAITKYGATHSGGPNFAYDLCVRKVTPEQRAGLDLSSWRVAYNGAEPVQAATLDRFVEAFGPHGFRRSTFFPCYGLAEATLFVSGGAYEAAPRIEVVDAEALSGNRVVPLSGDGYDPEAARRLVSSGLVWDDQQVRIVHPDTLSPCPPDQVGEIWISGGSVTRGYWQRPETTERTFEAQAADVTDIATTPSLRTGDLGFVREGELFVTGRLKDLIIIRGRNHYPQDIEATVAEAHPDVRPAAGAAVSIEVEGEERLAIVTEVRRTALRDLDVDGIARAIRQAVSETHELQAHTVVLIKTGGIPKTTSGKIQRKACRIGLLAGTLHEVGRDALDTAAAPVTEGPSGLDRQALMALPPADRRPLVAYHLQQLVAKSLQVQAASLSQQEPLSALGLDSLDVVELKLALDTDLSLDLQLDEDLADLTIDQLARLVVHQLHGGAAGDGAADAAPAGPVERDLFAKADTDGGYFGKYRQAKDEYFTQPKLEGPIGPHMKFQGKDVIVWSVNNYLGLAHHDHIRTRTRQTLDEWGTWSPMGSRLLTGNTAMHQALERRLAGYLGKESSIVWNFGYMGVMGTIASMVDGKDTVILDSLSHACIVDGAWVAAAGKPFRVFKHNDLNSLEDQLKAADRTRKGGILVVTEGVYGMSGDLAPLPEICALKDQYGARLFVDDAHGFGVMGPTGAGTGEHFGVQDQIDLYFGTFAKSFAAIGGVTAGDDRVIDYIRFNARTNVFAKSLPLVYVDAVDAALDLIEQEPERKDHVWHIARSLQAGLKEMGFDTGRTASLITPVYVPAGDEETTLKAIRMLRDELGIFASAVTYPVVPRGVMLFRLTATASHTDEDVARTLEAFSILRDRLNLRPTGDGAPSASASVDLVEGS
ncbi:MAG: aminotransferase class I/II-fold pyridoxal phosphate-dependent enzyme [Bacteroidota bacterium]